MTDSAGPMSAPDGMVPLSGPGVLGGPAAASPSGEVAGSVPPLGGPGGTAPQIPVEELPRVSALGEVGMAWASRGIWALCIGVYLSVFVGGILARGAELVAM